MKKILFSDAFFSKDRLYRYALWRIWDNELPKVLFIGLNPSTADEVKDDPTIRRCIRYALDWAMEDTLWEIFLLIVLQTLNS